MLNKFLKFIANASYRFEVLDRRGFYNSMDDEKYLKKKFKAITGKELDLENPKSFNEKLQWLKLYNRKEEYTIMADKIAARDYVAKKLGEEYLIPCLGVWNSPDEIDFDKLPDKFVLKCNHNSGVGMCICKDKSKLDIEKVKNELKKGMEQDYYITNREWPYKNIPRKIIAEQFMENKEEGIEGLRDYKFYCFNGTVDYLYISEGLDDHNTAKISFVTTDWNLANFKRTDYANFTELPNKPKNFDKMLGIAKELSKGFPFLRVDLYEINGKIYFSEFTFFPCGGMMPFEPEEWNYKFGELIKLK